MNVHTRDVLRQAGAEAGPKARADAGLPKYVEDHQAVQRMAELLIKASDRRLSPRSQLRRYANG
jgi:hypothetical protein